MISKCCGASPLGEIEIGICSDCREHCDFEIDDAEGIDIDSLKKAKQIEVAKKALAEVVEEIVYQHENLLSEEERNHPRGSGWARVYDSCCQALKELEEK